MTHSSMPNDTVEYKTNTKTGKSYGIVLRRKHVQYFMLLTNPHRSPIERVLNQHVSRLTAHKT